MEANTNEKFGIKKLGEQDVRSFQNLIQLFAVVFEMKGHILCEESYLKGLLKKNNFIVYTAISENEVVGGLTAYELPMYHRQGSEIFIYDIAVKAEHQRKGLGKKLLTALEEQCKQNNISTMFVAANEEDQHALDFYRSSGAKEEKVVHFNYDFNK